MGSDLKKVDARALTETDYDEIPELSDEWFARAKWHKGGVALPRGPRGRPKSDDPKQAVSVRLDADVLAHFRKGGAGWQSRINAALRKAAKLPERKTRRKA
jgi:uncharacterized protein (DUF4415 family)